MNEQRAQIGDDIIWGSKKKKLIVLQIDRNLNFNEYVSSLCKNWGNTLSPCNIIKCLEY